MQHTCLCHQSV